jgi:hypothetical protein
MLAHNRHSFSTNQENFNLAMNLRGENRAELGYNVMKGTECFVSL